MTRLTLAFLAGALVGGLVVGVVRGSGERPVAPLVFRPVPSEGRQSAIPVQAIVPRGASDESAGLGFEDTAPRPEPSTWEHPSAAPLSPRPSAAPKAAPPRPSYLGTGSARTVTGTASWYCLPGRSACTRGYPASGMYAAAGPALRIGKWRGRVVTVEAGGRRVAVRLSDWCACPRRVVDLYASVVRRLGLDLDRGVYRVRVSW